MATIAFIQARMGSTRLPGKVLQDIGGVPVLHHVVRRVQAASSVDEVVVLTTVDLRDLPVVEWCARSGVRVYCGSESDVLDRFYQAARLMGPDTVLRITADCPLIDPRVIDAVVALYRRESAEYANNVENETFPDGLDVEVISAAALERSWKEARLASEREHVTPYIRKNPRLFKIAVLDHSPSLGSHRWTLDHPEDLAFIREVFERIGRAPGFFGMEEVLSLLEQEPTLRDAGGRISRNEGYRKSLDAERPQDKG